MTYKLLVLFTLFICGVCFSEDGKSNSELGTQLKSSLSELRDIQKKIDDEKNKIKRRKGDDAYSAVSTTLEINVKEFEMKLAVLEYERKLKEIKRLQELNIKTCADEKKKAEEQEAAAKAYFDEITKILGGDGASLFEANGIFKKLVDEQQAARKNLVDIEKQMAELRIQVGDAKGKDDKSKEKLWQAKLNAQAKVKENAVKYYENLSKLCNSLGNLIKISYRDAQTWKEKSKRNLKSVEDRLSKESCEKQISQAKSIMNKQVDESENGIKELKAASAKIPKFSTLVRKYYKGNSTLKKLEKKYLEVLDETINLQVKFNASQEEMRFKERMLQNDKFAQRIDKAQQLDIKKRKEQAVELSKLMGETKQILADKNK